MSTQLFHIPKTKDLKGNREMHEHLVPASYHRVTAIGSALRLVMGEYHESIVETLVSCIRNAKSRDQKVTEWLRVMRDAAPHDVKHFIERIIEWQDQAENYLASAERLLRQMGKWKSPEGYDAFRQSYSCILMT